MRCVRARFCVLLMVGFLSACSSVIMHTAVPEKASSEAVVKGFPPDIRFWADEAPANAETLVMKRLQAYRETYSGYYQQHGKYPDLNYIAFSGGAYDGAFGAGLISGWTKTGKRPEFAIVTGVSTGALLAPFVFLGEEYDPVLKRLFTEVSDETIFEAGFFSIVDGLTGGLAITDNTPLARNIEYTITPEIIEKIAERHRQGKRIFISTTNMEAQRGVIWDIGAIAASGRPGARKLIHKVILASASVPGIFKPVFINVEANGKTYQEIHTDGGVTSNVFIYPLRIRRSLIDEFVKYDLKRHLYIVRNSKVTPEYKPLDPGLFSIARRSLETVTKYHGIGDLYRLYVVSQRDGVDYNLVYIPESFVMDSREIFDHAYMSALYEVGFKMGSDPDIWLKKPPGADYAPDEEEEKIEDAPAKPAHSITPP